MAQIQEYLPQSEAQQPVGGTSPNIELAGAVGRSIQNLGNTISEGQDLLHRRQAQEETADVYADFADQRAKWTDHVQKGVQDGSLNVDKLKEDFDTETGTLAEKIQTPEGKNYFERQQSRLRGHLLQMAATGQAQVAAKEAQGKWQTGLNSTAASVQLDPTSFQDAYESGIESVDQLIKTGGLPEKMRDSAVNKMGKDLSVAALRGWMDTDPAKAEHMLKSGAYDQFLDGNERKHMQNEINQAFNASEAEDARTQRAIEKAQAAAQEEWGQKALPQLASNSLKPKEVLSAVQAGTLKWETGERWLNMIKQGAKEELATDPRVKNQLIQRIVNPDDPNPIGDIQDLMPYVGKGISISDFNQMNSLFNKTDEQKTIHQSEKYLFDTMKKTIRFKNPMTGQYDLLGEQKLAKAMSDYAQAKKQARESGGDVTELLNPNNKDGFYQKLREYETPLSDQLNQQAQTRTNEALNIAPSKPGESPKAPANDKVRRPGETIQQYKKRMGG